MFSTGQEIVFVDAKIWGIYGGYLRGHGLHTHTPSHKKVYAVTRTKDYSDGSQQLWVRARYGTQERGPFCSLRFKAFTDGKMFRYDPSQLGDLDDDI